jgi:hypothetical protein
VLSAARKLWTLSVLGLVLSAAGCNDTTTFEATTPPPTGVPGAYGWDGVDKRMMMVLSPAGRYGDLTVWTLHGSTWTVSPAPPATNVVPTLLAYDSARNRVVLVAASTSLAPQIWEWDGHAWSAVETAHFLPGFLWSAAYSPELHSVVAFASLSNPPRTYLYDGTDWREAAAAGGPNGGAAHVAYDPIRHQVIAFSQPDYHTWLFDGASWTALPLRPGTTPDYGFVSGRQSPASALDQQTDQWVDFGGFDGSQSYADTWVGDGSSWTRVSPQTSPPARTGAGLAWDATAQRLVLFGGDTMGIGLLGDTWAWDGATWSRLS